MSKFLSFLKQSKIQMALSLFVFFIWSLFQSTSLEPTFRMVIAIGGCVITDLLFVVIPNLFRNLHRPLFLPSASLVSGLIIGLLSPPHMYGYVLLAAFLAMTIKNMVRISNRHIFNPAASGLLVSSLIFNQSVAWSAAPIFLFIFPAFVSLVRVRKYYLILSFLFLYTLLLNALNTQSILNTLFDPTILFFSLVMLPEPMTSPFNLKKQLLFGSFVAVLVMGISLLAIPIDPLIAALLIANAAFFKFR